LRQFDDYYDVIVIGGGPAGSASAGLLAQRGRKVLLLEREKFPRYHIGESFLTGGIPTLNDLGMFQRVEDAAFVKKYGGTFRWGSGDEVWNFRFKDAAKWEYAFQLRRADFDALLLTRARELGVTVVEEASVSDILSDGDRVCGVEYSARWATGKLAARARFVVDASGQAHLLARRFKLLRWHEDLRNMAVWAYFQGCDRYEGTRAGDVVVEHRPDGWFWFIPLMDGTTGVGYVTPIANAGKAGAESARRELAELFTEQLAQTKEVGRLTAGARQVSDFRTARDWSYSSERLQGPGWALVGDAAAFIDPLMATGITIALRSARGLAAAVDWTLSHPDSTVVMERYERDYQRFIGQLIEFIMFFYNGSRRKEEYWTKAQDIVDPERQNNNKLDFVTLLSGLYGLFRDLKSLTADVDGAER
jgi:flavin-dependent dehydrogenase